jgi:[ribosomal protein S18]-alanine N-acetyltransferase
MNAVLRPQLQPPPLALRAMTREDLDAVMAIEREIYDFPWSPGNFEDSIRSGYLVQALVSADRSDELLGYLVAMTAAGEMHLLNLSVAAPMQGRGHARAMLDALCAYAREGGLSELWLEVRESNARARLLYERYGFRHIGVRRGYYPAANRRRENAIVMGLLLQAEG